MFDIKINGKTHRMTAKEIESNLSEESKEIFMNLEEAARKRRTCPVFSNTYDNGGWSERDSLPTKDPIGDVDEEKDEYVDGYKAWLKGQQAYEKMMATKVLNPEGKYTHDNKPLKYDLGFEIVEKKCDCGTFKTYGKVPIDAHQHYCKLRS